MANLWGKDKQFKLDNASGSATAIHSHMNDSSIQTSFDILEDTAFGDQNPTVLHGIARMTIPILVRLITR